MRLYGILFEMKNDAFLALLKHASHIGAFFVIIFFVLFAWQALLSDPEVNKLHMEALKLIFPGFAGMDGLSIFLAGVQSFIYGFLLSLAFHFFHDGCCVTKK